MQTPDSPIKIGLLGFFKHTNPVTNHITSALSKRFKLEICTPDNEGHLHPIPEILFVSLFERNGIVPQYRFWPYHSADPYEEPLSLHPRYNRCTKIFTSDENIRTPWYECDYSLTSDYLDDPRHLRLPIYQHLTLEIIESHPESIQRKNLILPNPKLIKNPSRDWKSLLNRKFCAFVYTNPRPQERVMFFKLLSKYKRVDSGGDVMNNLGSNVEREMDSHTIGKLAFVQNYKFTIAFENSSHPGYVTEKLTDAMVVDSVPIYWGCPRVGEEFNQQSFVTATGRKFQDVVDEVVELDRNDDKYIKMLRQPWFQNNEPNQYCDPALLHKFFEKVILDHRSKQKSQTS
jgi:hypothetical protein